MKNNTKKLLALTGLLLLCVAMLPRMAGAVNLPDAQLADVDQTMVASTVDSAKSSALNLVFTGHKQSGLAVTSTGAYVTISASAMTFYQPFGTLDTSMGSAGVVTFASTLGANTMGSLCDYINNRGASYKCTLGGAKRDDAPALLATQTATDGTNNLAAAGGETVLVAISGNFSQRLGITPSAGHRVVLHQCVSNTPGTDTIVVYGQLRKNERGVDQFGVVADDTYPVWSAATAANTTAYQPTQYATMPWIEFATDAHVVVSAGNASNQQVATSHLACFWSEK